MSQNSSEADFSDQPVTELAKNPKNTEEERSLENLRKQQLEQDIQDQKVHRELRWKYAIWIYRYLVFYSLLVYVMRIFQGFNILSFSLPESVLNFLVGSTAVSAIGLVLAVTTGLFRTMHKDFP